MTTRHMLGLLALTLVPAVAAPQDAPDASAAGAKSRPAVSIGATERVVFLGDSITEQNLYSEYLETFLLSRFPQSRIVCFNFGVGGDTAPGGLKRFARDVEPVKPSLVFVNFGMNDGSYQAYNDKTFRRYMDAQRALAEAIRAAGAREVLFTTSPVDETRRADLLTYNDTLARLRQGVIDLGNELWIPVIDLFGPMHEVVARAREREPGSTMIPDAVHPDPVGHMVMAYLAMRAIDAPREIGEIVVRGGQPSEVRGVELKGVSAHEGGLEFEMAPPFLPFYVPPEARPALALVPLEEEENRFRLKVEDAAEGPWVLSADGVDVGTFTATELHDGIDLALLDKAPWTRQARLLYETAQLRWQKHFEAWRRMGIDRPATMMPDLPSFEPLARAQRAYADDLGAALGRLARPGTYHVGLWRRGERVALNSAQLSPAYPFETFDTAYPPEVHMAAVSWKAVPFKEGQIDFGQYLGGPTDVVAYARVVLETESACTVHLAMGSDDGLAVFVNGRRVFAHDVARPLKPGEDETEIALKRGRNDVLFKVTQGSGDFGLAVEAEVRGGGQVTQVAAE